MFYLSFCNSCTHYTIFQQKTSWNTNRERKDENYSICHINPIKRTKLFVNSSPRPAKLQQWFAVAWLLNLAIGNVTNLKVHPSPFSMHVSCTLLPKAFVDGPIWVINIFVDRRDRLNHQIYSSTWRTSIEIWNNFFSVYPGGVPICFLFF